MKVIEWGGSSFFKGAKQQQSSEALGIQRGERKKFLF